MLAIIIVKTVMTNASGVGDIAASSRGGPDRGKNSGMLMIGCGNGGTQTVVLNQAANGGAGAIVAKITAISGSDEIWYDPLNGDFYLTGSSGGHRVIDVISDATDALLQSIDLTALGASVNAHSVAVDPFNGDIFVPLEGTTAAATDTLCPLGCVAVFAQVPEPSSLLLTFTALLGLAGLGWLRRTTR